MSIPCAITMLSTKGADGYPADGAQTITFDANSAATLIACGMAESDANSVPSGTTISITTSTPADTTVYTKKTILDLASFGGDTIQTMYYKTTTSKINVVSVETYTRESRSQISRTMVSYDVAAGKLSAEYVSTSDDTSNGGFYLQRIAVDRSTDTAGIYSHTGNSSAAALGTYFTLAGKPEAGGTLALSLMASDSGNTLAASSACVNIEDGSIATADSLACTLTGLAVDSTDVLAMDADAFGARAGTGWTDISLTEALSFTPATVSTALASH